MRGIGRVLAAIVLAGAVAGAAAFAHSLGGGPLSAPAGVDVLPTAPASPLVVQATAALPALRPALRPTVGHAVIRPVSTVVAQARPIAVVRVSSPPLKPGEPAAAKPVAPPAAPTPAPTPAAPPPAPTPAPAAPVRVVAAVQPPAETAQPAGGKHEHGHHGRPHENQPKANGKNKGAGDESGEQADAPPPAPADAVP